MRDVRVHLRHAGDSRFMFRVTRLRPFQILTPHGIQTNDTWGYNINFFRWYLVFRDRKEDPAHYKPNGFFDLSFGRSMLKTKRIYASMTKEEHIAYDHIRSEGQWQGIRLDKFLELYRNGTLKWPMS